MRFAGRTIRPRAGVAMTLRGLPKQLRAGSRTTLTITVLDQFKRAVTGATVTVSGTGIALRATTDGQGRATIAMTAPNSGQLTVRASDPGHAATTTTIAIVG